MSIFYNEYNSKWLVHVIVMQKSVKSMHWSNKCLIHENVNYVYMYNVCVKQVLNYSSVIFALAFVIQNSFIFLGFKS